MKAKCYCKAGHSKYISILNVFSKIYEKILKNQLIPYLDETLLIFIAAYRKAYGTQHVLIRMMEKLRVKLDNDNIIGAIFMNLSKAFYCNPQDLLIAKLHAYGCDENALEDRRPLNNSSQVNQKQWSSSPCMNWLPNTCVTFSFVTQSALPMSCEFRDRFKTTHEKIK